MPPVAYPEQVAEWLSLLAHEDRKMMAIMLYQYFTVKLNNTRHAAQETANICKITDRTVFNYAAEFKAHNGSLHKSKRRSHQTHIWDDEECNRKATKYVREHASVKGQPNITNESFCQFVNEDLLPNSTLSPDMPREISMSTAYQWLHKLGFEVLSSSKKGIFIDGHEREDDVVADRKDYLQFMAKLELRHVQDYERRELEAQHDLSQNWAEQVIDERGDLTTQQELEHLQMVKFESDYAYEYGVYCQSLMKELIIQFHDESAYNANEDESRCWGGQGQSPNQA